MYNYGGDPNDRMLNDRIDRMLNYLKLITVVIKSITTVDTKIRSLIKHTVDTVVN